MSNSGKILTLVVPSYNMDRYLSVCLDSVTADCISDALEVIVVNDGSVDSTLEIAREYEARRPDIVTVIDKDNGNYGSCVNVGLAQATGKYFRILDADDYADTTALADFMSRLQNCEADLVVSLIVEDIYKNDRKIDERHYSFDAVRKNHIYKADEFYIHTHVFSSEFRMHGMTYKTSVLKKSGLRLLEGICYTDNIYLFQPFAYISTFVVYDLYLYHYRMGRDGQTMDLARQKKNLRDITLVVDFILHEFELTPQDEHLKTNQKALLNESLGLFIGILKMQKSVPCELYEHLHYIIMMINKYGISHRELRRKWYFRLWKLTESSRVLSLVLGINGLVK